MDPKEKLAQLAAEADRLRTKAADTPNTFTEADAARATAVVKEHRALKAMLDKRDGVAQALMAAGGGQTLHSSADEAFSTKTFNSRGGVPLGQAEKTKEFSGSIMKALKNAAPTIGGPSVGKALVPNGAVTADFDGRVVNDPRAAFSIIAAINGREVDSPSGTYLQQTQRVNNAATVPAGGLKPVSQYGLTPATWEIATIAHLSEPIKRQWLEDYAALDQFLSQELAYGIDSELADFVLNGGTSEDGNMITGIMNTTGIQQTAYTTNKLLTIRRALGELETAGIDATGIILNPSDWEEIETLTDADGNFMLGMAPQQSADRQLWNTPVTLAPGLAAGQSIIGDLSTVSLLHRNSLQLAWSEGSTNTGTVEAPVIRDLFRHNEVVFRAEVRVGLEILSTKALRVADLTA
ncbi:phage major capsid protein [Arthrobacter sp. GCM10027362]|uniref:phage major capsid protein n=1 Tax=Arthrobacter sp. GCM10027362 TaxID=3273379 RepID=UPI00363D9880